MICDFLLSFSRREDKRPAPARGHAPEPRPHHDIDPLGPAPEVSRKAKRGVPE
jgi:hypothetical protein